MGDSTLQMSSQRNRLAELMTRLASLSGQDEIEAELAGTFSTAEDDVAPDSDGYYDVLNYHLYRHIRRMYAGGEEGICIWRFFKRISLDQLSCKYEAGSSLELGDFLMRVYFYSDPLDDLTCIFIPVGESSSISEYLEWIKNYFYNVNYPTSLLWFYALDSSISGVVPDEIIFMGRAADRGDNIILPDFDYPDSVLLKRFSADEDDYILLERGAANREFGQIFDFLKAEYQDRCLSHTGKQEDYTDEEAYRKEWEKFREVLEFGVSDREQSGTISFSDLRNSTNFLTRYGKNLFRNLVQQPFFEKTKLISKNYSGRIDKFMGDNVMCAFLSHDGDEETAGRETVVNNFCALFGLCRVLLELLNDGDMINSELGLRSGVCYGTQILRSNLGNEIVRDFTVTGNTVNLAARLEHFSIHELIIHNQNYFEDAIERFPRISQLVSTVANQKHFNPATRMIIQRYTLYENIISNLESLEKTRFDIRCNHEFFKILKKHLIEAGYEQLNAETAAIHGFEEFDICGHSLKFYYSYYNPKGFDQFEKIWLVPLTPQILMNLNIDCIR